MREKHIYKHNDEQSSTKKNQTIVKLMASEFIYLTREAKTLTRPHHHLL